MNRFSKIVISALFFIVFIGQCTFAQERPQWTNGYFEESKNSYIEVVVGEGYDLEDAKKKATQQIIARRSLATGTDATVSSLNNNLQVVSEKKLIVNARIVDEYHERLSAGIYKVYLLVQTAKNPTFTLEPVTVSEKYPFSARVFVPGMAQIYKGSVAKGACFIAGEVVFIGGIVAAECLRNNYEQQIGMTHNSILKQQYANKANACIITRNVCIAGAAALYVWNVIDGIVAKGKKHVMVGTAQLHMAPYATYDGGGLAMRFNF